MRILDNPKEQEFYGCGDRCALEAIAFIFDLTKEGTLFAFNKFGKVRTGQGPTQQQCHKIIQSLCLLTDREFRYYRKQTYSGKLLQRLNPGIYLVNQEEHLASLKGKTFYDNYDSYVRNTPVLGFWHISKPGKSLGLAFKSQCLQIDQSLLIPQLHEASQ